MSNRKTHLSDPTIVQCMKNLSSHGNVTLTIGDETYILNPMQEDIQNAISHISKTKKCSRCSEQPSTQQSTQPSIHVKDNGENDSATTNDKILEEQIDNTSPCMNELDNTLDVDVVDDSLPEEKSITISVFQAHIIKKQLGALSLNYSEALESDICDIPERDNPGSQEWQRYINTCFRIWEIHSK